MTECPRLGKWFRGCNWEARYSVKKPSVGRNLGLSGFGEFASMSMTLKGDMSAEDTLKLNQQNLDATMEVRTYEGDICTTCGKFRAAPSKDNKDDS